TVHANSAAATIPRLVSLGLKNAEIASVLSAMVAQRLVRRIPEAKADLIEWVKPNDIEREWLIKHGLYGETQYFPRIGREHMSGRISIVEMIEMTPKIRSLLESSHELNHMLADITEEAVLQPQFETLAQAGVRLALEGKTTLAEAMHAAADIGYIPQRKRFEQILVRQGAIAINVLDALQKELALLREAGHLVNLDEELVERGLCSVEDVTQAIRLAGYYTTKTA
ncbi:MAG: ATPase, T2SS/T4P/T4SS family, partial [Rhodoferax sp.]